LRQSFLDGTFLDRDQRMLAWVPLGILALFAARGLGDFMQTYCMGLRGVVSTLRSQLFGRLMYLPLAYDDPATAGTLLSRLLFNTEQVSQASTESILALQRESLIITGSLIRNRRACMKAALTKALSNPIVQMLAAAHWPG
jgi:ATP-binding cassette, subfamily B, bacterial MsbA